MTYVLVELYGVPDPTGSMIHVYHIYSHLAQKQASSRPQIPRLVHLNLSGAMCS